MTAGYLLCASLIFVAYIAEDRLAGTVLACGCLAMIALGASTALLFGGAA